MSKGGSFEREISRTLTTWWTGSDGGDVCFWRTAGSGGRATRRGKFGRSTAEQHCGDISALTPDAGHLTKFMILECKKGYSSAHLHALLDNPHPTAKSKWVEWIEKATIAANHSKSAHWCIIHSRTRRNTIIVFPIELWHDLGQFRVDGPVLRLWWDGDWLMGITLASFLAHVKPDAIRAITKISG